MHFALRRRRRRAGMCAAPPPDRARLRALLLPALRAELPPALRSGFSWLPPGRIAAIEAGALDSGSEGGAGPPP
eukprot:gene7222-3042_t